MKRAVWVGVAIITSFYFLVSVLGYLAYGYEALYGGWGLVGVIPP